MPPVEGLLEERNDSRREGDPSGIFMPENVGLGSSLSCGTFVT